jgi:hypothetical protein
MNVNGVALRLGGHDLAVVTSRWDDEKECVVLVYDGLQDHRTPALTATDARELARMLVAAADEINPLTVVR